MNNTQWAKLTAIVPRKVLPYNHLFQFIEASYFMVWYIATIVLYLECELDCNETDKPYRIVQAILRPVLKHTDLSTVG